MPRKGGLESTVLHLYKPLPRNGLFHVFQAAELPVEAVVSWTAHAALADRYKPFQPYARSAHHRTSNTVPTASNKCVTPELVIPPKTRTAHKINAARPASKVGASNVDAMIRSSSSVDSTRADLYLSARGGGEPHY
jgi:hypothetical protein